LETSARQGSVAALSADGVLAQRALATDQRSAQSLIPAIFELLAEVDWQPSQIQLIAVTKGPGSFTGLRVGVTAAKTLAYATGAELIGVDTLSTIASQIPEPIRTGGTCHVTLDAQRGQLFAGAFEWDEQGWPRRTSEIAIVDRDRWLGHLTTGCVVTGPGLQAIADRLPDAVVATPPSHWEAQAIGVGRLARRLYQQGRRDDPWSMTPEYVRRSAAEERLT